MQGKHVFSAELILFWVAILFCKNEQHVWLKFASDSTFHRTLILSLLLLKNTHDGMQLVWGVDPREHIGLALDVFKSCIW